MNPKTGRCLQEVAILQEYGEILIKLMRGIEVE